ncbi:hypothetical protein D3C86_1434540 [compost metagenome]
MVKAFEKKRNTVVIQLFRNRINQYRSAFAGTVPINAGQVLGNVHSCIAKDVIKGRLTVPVFFRKKYRNGLPDACRSSGRQISQSAIRNNMAFGMPCDLDMSVRIIVFDAPARFDPVFAVVVL